MTDLTGPELALAVALTMGARKDPNRPDHERQIVWPDGRIQICAGPDSPVDPIHKWWPLTYKAQRGDVHDWVRAQGYDVDYWTEASGTHYCRIYVSINDNATGTGPDDATALCRAVVEMAESTRPD